MSIDNKSNKILYVRKFGHKIRPKKKFRHKEHEPTHGLGYSV